MSVAQALLGAAARNPPALTRLSGARTAFNASIGAPARNKRSVVCARSASVTPSPRRLQQSRSASGNQGQHDNALVELVQRGDCQVRRLHPALVRNGMTGFVNPQLRREQRASVALLGDDVAGDDVSMQCLAGRLASWQRPPCPRRRHERPWAPATPCPRRPGNRHANRASSRTARAGSTASSAAKKSSRTRARARSRSRSPASEGSARRTWIRHGAPLTRLRKSSGRGASSRSAAPSGN